MAEVQQVRAVLLQLAGQPGGRLALGDAAQEQHDLGGPVVALVEFGAGEDVEDPAAAGAAVVEHGGAVAAVHLEPLAGFAPRACQAVGVEDRGEQLVAGVLVHQVDHREIHVRLRPREPRCRTEAPSLSGQSSWINPH